MAEHLNNELERLKTFDNTNWQCEFMDKIILAKIGMYYYGESDKVKCYFCDVIIGRWELDDHPITEHIRWSPNCPLLKRRTTNNQPIDDESLDRLLPPISYDVCGSNDMIEVRQDAYAEGTIHTPPGTTPTIFSSLHQTPISSPNYLNLINNSSSITTVDDQQQQQKQISDDKLCKICYVGEYNTTFLPCGHVVACDKCASSVTKCPMCRKPFTDVMRVYFS